MLKILEKYGLVLLRKGSKKPYIWCRRLSDGRNFSGAYTQEEAVAWASSVIDREAQS